MTSPEARGDLPSFSEVINSLGACGDLPRSASLGACGSPPLERVEHRVDRLPWSVWITFLERVDGRPWSAWITSLRAHGWSLGACGCALGHTDGLSLDHRQAARSCGPTCARCCGHMHHRLAQSVRATARRRNAKGRNDQRVCIFVPELCCRGFSGLAPNYLK
jgi:hypothetical protein